MSRCWRRAQIARLPWGCFPINRNRDPMTGLVWFGPETFGSPPTAGERPRLRPKRDPVRDGNGQKDGVTTLPEMLYRPLEEHLRQVRKQHEADEKSGLGQAPLPHALARKYPRT